MFFHLLGEHFSLGKFSLGSLLDFFYGGGSLFRGGGILVSIVFAVHLDAQGFLASLKEFVIVSSDIGSFRNAFEIPSIQLSCETGILGLAKILR